MPVLVIVAEGGRETSTLVENILIHEIPILVIKGSGKLADLISDCLDNTYYLSKEEWL